MKRKSIEQNKTNQTERKIELLTEMLHETGISRDEIVSAAIDVGINAVLAAVLNEEEYSVRTALRDKMCRPKFHGEVIGLG